jgi:outer membrane protein assembly factor BamB/tetratricopeptide (TPR) repeat protein
MSFKGDLSTIGLAEVFQMISMSQKEGTLVVVDTDSRKSIYFGSTGVRLLSTGRRKGQKLGDVLLRAGKITQAQLDDALENAKILKKRLGEVLVEIGAVGESDIDQVVREQIEEEIYDLFLWKRADFEFVEGPPADDLTDPDSPVTKLAFDVNGLLLEAVRRADEWAIINQKIPSLDSVFVFCSEADRSEEDKVAPDALKRVYRLLDGRRTALEVVEGTGVSKFDACKALIDLQERGRIRLLTVQEIMDLATARMNEGHKDGAVRMFVAAAAQAGPDAKVVAGVARVLENEGLAREASVHHLKASKIFIDQGDLDRALDHAQSAVQLQPDDPRARMGMFEVHAALGNLDEGKKIARELAVQALVAPDYGLAKTLCDRILGADPTDIDFRLMRAKALFRSGDKAGSQADVDFIRAHMPTEAKDVDRLERDLREFAARAATAAPSRSNAAVPGKTTSAPAAKGKRKGAGLKAALILGGLLGVGAAGYELLARQACGTALGLAEGFASQEKFGEARQAVEGFLAGPYRFSPSGKDRAAAFLGDLAQRRDRMDNDRKAREDARRKEVREEIQKSMAAIRESRLREPAASLTRARAVREQADKSGEPELRQECDQLAALIEKYLSDALQLKVKADTLEKEGNVRESALMIDRLKLEFPNTEAAQSAFYPLEILTRPSGVKVTNLVTGQVVGETKDGRLIHRMRAGETVRLQFEKAGWGSVERSVKEKTLGRIGVELTEKKMVWSKALGVTSSGEPALWGETLYLAGASKVYALRLDPFALLWFESLDGAIEGGVRPSRTRLYAGTSGGTLVAIDPSRRADRVVLRKDLGTRVSGTPGLSADEQTLYVALGDRTVRALRAADFEELWKRELPAEARLEPVMAGGAVVVACSDGTLLGLKPATGEDAWSLRADGPLGPMTVHGSEVYSSSADQHVYAIDAAAGRRLWRRLLPAMPTGRPMRGGDLVVSSARDGKVYLLSAATGERQGEFAAEGPILGGVTVAGALALFGSDDRSFYAYDLERRELTWRLKSPGRLRQPAVVAGGRAYFGGEDSLYAVDLE